MTEMGESSGFDYEDSDFTIDDIRIAYSLLLKMMFPRGFQE
jgi:hypothetical protein